MSSEGAQQLNKTMTTFSSLYYHLVWSTKNREKTILEFGEQPLYKYLIATVKNLEGRVLNINGMPDHVHMLISIRPSISIPDLVRNVKVSSTKMMRQRNNKLSKFEWQDSYGIFIVSKSQTNAVSEYIDNQKIHHQNMPFENELLTLLKLHEINFEEKYVFG